MMEGGGGGRAVAIETEAEGSDKRRDPRQARNAMFGSSYSIALRYVTWLTRERAPSRLIVLIRGSAPWSSPSTFYTLEPTSR